MDSQQPSTVIADVRYAFDRMGRPYAEQRLHEPVGAAYRTRLLRANRAGQLDQWVEGNLSTSAVPSPTVADPTTAIASPTDLETWTLDPLGNWSEHARGVGASATESSFDAANSLNQYSSVVIDGGAPQEFNYDWLGQTRTDEASQEKFAWDAFGRMTRVTDLEGTMKSEFRYDALGRRVQRKLNTPIAGDNWIIYLSFGHTILEERAVSPTFTETPRARYGYKGGLQVAWVDRDVATTAGAPNPTTGTYAGQLTKRYFVHTDQLGSTIAVSDLERGPSEQLLIPERYTYTAYGEVTSWAGSWNDGYADALGYSRYGPSYLFTGQRQDLQLSSYAFRFRYYDPRTGRFRSRDPLSYADGLNLYQYVWSAPHAAIDPLGLRSTDPYGDTMRLDPTGILYANRNSAVTDNRCAGTLGVSYSSCQEKVDALSNQAKSMGDQNWFADDWDFVQDIAEMEWDTEWTSVDGPVTRDRKGRARMHNESTLRLFYRYKGLKKDEYSVVIDKMPPGMTPEQYLKLMAIDLNRTVSDRIFDAVNMFRRRQMGPPEVGDIVDIDILGPDDGSVMITELTPTSFTFTTIETDETGSHPEVGSRQFGFDSVGDATRFYTRGSSQPRDALTGLVGAGFQNIAWSRLMRGISDSIDEAGGISRPNSFEVHTHWE